MHAMAKATMEPVCGTYPVPGPPWCRLPAASYQSKCEAAAMVGDGNHRAAALGGRELSMTVILAFSGGNLVFC